MEVLGIGSTSAELRLRVYQFESYFAAAVQTASEEILAAETDRELRANALRWRINAVPAIQSAAFQLDPLAALADVWGLCAQMDRFFRDGAGQDLFGDSQAIAIEIAGMLHREARALAETTTGPELFLDAAVRIDEWSEANPLYDLTFGRRGYISDASAITAAEWGTGGLRTVAQMEELVRDLSDRLTLYSEQVPELARWHTELILLEVDRDLVEPRWSTVENVDASLESVRDELAAVRAVVDETPELVSRERALILEAVRADLDAALLDVDRQRAATLAAVTAEREAILAAAERLQAQVTTDLERVRATATTEVEAVVERQAGLVLAETEGWIDKVFRRALILVAFALVGLALVLRFAPARRTAA